MKRLFILCLTALLCHGLNAQTRQGIIKADMTRIHYDIENPNEGKLKPEDFGPIDWSNAKTYTTTITDDSDPPGAKSYLVKGVVVDSTTHRPLNKVKCYTVMGKSLQTPRENITRAFDIKAISNKKGKISWKDYILYLFRPDSLASYIFEHPDMEPYGITVHVGYFGQDIDLDTLFMVPKHKKMPIRRKEAP